MTITTVQILQAWPLLRERDLFVACCATRGKNKGYLFANPPAGEVGLAWHVLSGWVGAPGGVWRVMGKVNEFHRLDAHVSADLGLALRYAEPLKRWCLLSDRQREARDGVLADLAERLGIAPAPRVAPVGDRARRGQLFVLDGGALRLCEVYSVDRRGRITAYRTVPGGTVVLESPLRCWLLPAGMVVPDFDGRTWDTLGAARKYLKAFKP